MKVGETLMKRSCRLFELGPFRFEELRPLQLKNQVGGSSDKGADIACIQDMAVMFACLKANEFKESVCSKEIKIFTDCYNNHKAAQEHAKEQEKSGKTAPGAKTLTHRQATKLLQKYPQYNEPRHKIVYRK